MPDTFESSFEKFLRSNPTARQCTICNLPEHVREVIDEVVRTKKFKNHTNVSIPNIIRWLNAPTPNGLGLQVTRHMIDGHKMRGHIKGI